MQTIGMLGGMSWESTMLYYRIINEQIRAAAGGLHSAKILLYSVDFAEISRLQQAGDWRRLAEVLSDAAKIVESGGADFLLLCTNTMHEVAESIEAAVSVPLLHIADATAARLVADGVKQVGLLGTKWTMGRSFYKNRLSEKFGVKTVVPDEEAQDIIHDIIYSELCRGKISQKSRRQYLKIIDSLTAAGGEAVVLGCTEIALLVQRQHTAAKLYDTTEIHAKRAAELALSGGAQKQSPTPNQKRNATVINKSDRRRTTK